MTSPTGGRPPHMEASQLLPTQTPPTKPQGPSGDQLGTQGDPHSEKRDTGPKVYKKGVVWGGNAALI